MERLAGLRRRLADPRQRRWALVVGICGALTSLPLVGSLGYENAFVLSPVLAVLAMAVGVDQIRAARATDDEGARPDVGTLMLGGAREVALLHGLAIATLTIGRLWQRGCDPLGGLLFYAVGPGAASVVGWTCGLWAGVLATRRSRQLLLAWAPLLLCLGIGLWRLFAHPVIFAYDPFWGYFSGSVYDESIEVGRRYVLFRGYNALGVVAALAGWALLVERRRLVVTMPTRGRRQTVLAAVMAATGLGAAWIGFQATRFGFTSDAERIEEVLSATYETEHFVIHYVPRSPDARVIEAMAIEHEYAWARLAHIMGREPAQKVHSFIFEHADQKRALMGAGKVQVAAPWRYQIYLDHRGFPHRVLHHELAHVFGITIGDGLFGVSRDGLRLNIGLIEGLATALAPRSVGHLDLHDQAKILGELGKRPPIPAIMGPGFFGLSSRVAYTSAGSFCKWLIDTRGFEPMAVLYRTAGDFDAAYGESVEVLERGWTEFLARYEGVTPDDIEEQRERFEHPAVWERPCAHRVAEVARDIGRAAARAHFDEAVDGHRDLCALEPENPVHQLSLAVGLVNASQAEEALAVLRATEAMPGATVTIRSLLHERRGDIELELGRLPQASSSYAAALELPNEEGRRRVLTLKRIAASDPQLAPILRRYLAMFDTDGNVVTQAVARIHEATVIAALPRYEALGSYLWGRQLLHVQRPDAAAPLLERALQDGGKSLPDDDFRREAGLALMEASLLNDDYERAREVLGELESAPSIANGHRLEHEQWGERIDFFSREAFGKP